jgi:hypothetical protein
MGELHVALLGVGLLGPGLSDWPTSAAQLCDPALWQHAPTAVPPPTRLPANERRRASTVVKASIVVADQAVLAAGADAAQLATVFTSSTGDPLNCHLLCEALATPERALSPTRFTNSVHNAAAGYWHIATQSHRPSTSLAAYDGSFSAGLLEAAVQCCTSQQPVLLVACDAPYPEPLHAARPLSDVFAVALLLAPAAMPGAPGAARRLSLQVITETAATVCACAAFESMRGTIPAARALPLLHALAGDAAAGVVLEGQPGMALHVRVHGMPKAVE